MSRGDTAVNPQAASTGSLRTMHAVFGLFLVSGFTGLVYEVLWMKQLSLLFGNTAYAAATTLAAFFLGVAAGSYLFGRRASTIASPLRAYALLELGIAVTALAYFVLLGLYQTLYAPLFDVLGDTPALFVLVKFVLGIGVLFPPAFFMGGTLPMLSQLLVRRIDQLGRTVPLLYAVNTAGAALGALAAGFYLPAVIGFRSAYLVAIVLTLLVAAVAWVLDASAEQQPPGSSDSIARPAAPDAEALARSTLTIVAFLSGFLALALEVLWIRMFAQVLQNSVYTFTVILVIFLLCLSLGAVVAALLARRRVSAGVMLSFLLIATAAVVALIPPVFTWMSDGLDYVGGESSWGGYVARVFAMAALVMAVPVTLLGSVFPYLMKASEANSSGAGRTVGNLVALNTAGAITGSLVAGFVLLDTFGLWASVHLVAAGYLGAALALGAIHARRGRLVPLGAAGVVLVLMLLSDSSGLPTVKLEEQGEERLLEVWQDSAATVAVVERRRSVGRDGWAPAASLRIKVNNYYTLGGTAARKWESWQSHLPLVLHHAPRSVYYLGMGTGITAGAALDHAVDNVLVTEIVPAAVTASSKYFRPYVNGLYDDPRARVLIEDGRNYLLGTRERFDVIVADLFMPWKVGTGSLYTVEHYRAARERLTEHGLLVQWLPLYQMGKDEFGIIVRSLLEVFPLVTLWRGDFFSAAPAMALIGHRTVAPLDRDGLQRRLEQAAEPAIAETPLYHFVPDSPALLARPGVPPAAARFLLYYAGNLSAAAALFDDYPLNTDDRPVIEYRAPVTQRRQEAGRGEWFARAALIEFLERLLAEMPPSRDPYLQRFAAGERELVDAGLQFHRVQVLEYAGESAAAKNALRDFVRIVFASGS